MERGGPGGHDIVPLGRPAFDLTNDPEAIFAAIEGVRADLIVSAAAYTAVDKAEDEPDLAFGINATGAGAIAMAAHRLGLPLIHLSTDYVFDGAKAVPYLESDTTGPTGVYGASKLAGEQAVLAAHDDVAIIRTAWVYSPFGANFVKTMLRVAGERDEVAVVGDQRGNPTSALEIAGGIIAVAENLAVRRDQGMRGIFHMTGSGEASWAEFAEAIFHASAAAGGPTARVKSIATNDYPTRVRRPVNSRLAVDKLAAAHGVRLPDWRTSLALVVERLVCSDESIRTKA
jgi:dTDP-4-dehydrorhamnose reductase